MEYLPDVRTASRGPGVSSVYIRGLSTDTAGAQILGVAGVQPNVALYVNDAPASTPGRNLDIHPTDINRVEVLAGPQGTLFGANAMGGAIRYITNKPDLSEFHAGFSANASTTKGGAPSFGAEGFINVPVSHNAAVRLVGWYEHDAGYIDNVLTNYTFTNPDTGATVGTINNASVAKDDYNQVDTYGMRAALRVDLNENWTLLPTIMGQDQTADGFFAYDPRRGRLNVGHFYPETSHDRWYQAALTVQGRVANLDILYTTAYLSRTVDTQADYQDYGIYYVDQNATGAATGSNGSAALVRPRPS